MLRLAPLAVLLAVLPAPAAAQSYVHDARATAQLPSLLGRGDAGVAVPRRATAFFTNPAHVAATDGGFRLSLVGVSASVTPAALDTGSLVLDAAEGASVSTDDLVDGALQPVEARLGVLGPSLSLRAGAVGFSAGAFVQSRMRAQTRRSARDSLYAFGQVDAIGAATLSARVTDFVTVGAGLRVTRRYATTYALDADDLEALDDPALVEGTAAALDLGALWETPVDGLTAGLAVYDLGGSMEYAAAESDPLGLGSGSTREAARIVRDFDGRDGRASFRVGVAYRPLLPRGAPPVTLAADYVSASTSGYVQPALQHLRLGAETELGGLLALRAGVGGGGPAVGATLDLLLLKVDYALYTQPTGLFEEQAGGMRHALLLRLGRD